MGEPLDRLACVSRVLFDQRILDLQREKLELQKRVTEVEYGDIVLNTMLAGVNDTGLSEVCKCPGCYCAKRFADLEPDEVVARLSKIRSDYEWEQYPECLLQKCLIWQCERIGLSVQVDHGALDSDKGSIHSSEDSNNEETRDRDDESESDGEFDENDPAATEVYKWCAHDSMSLFRGRQQKIDCHIVIVNSGCGMHGVVYGRKFKDAGLFGNPDMGKLVELFELLRNGELFFEVDGTNYFHLADNIPMQTEVAV